MQSIENSHTALLNTYIYICNFTGTLWREFPQLVNIMDQWPQLHNNLSNAIFRYTFYYGLHIFIYHICIQIDMQPNEIMACVVLLLPNMSGSLLWEHQITKCFKRTSHPTGSGELDLEQCAYTALTGSCESRPLKRLNTSAGSPSELGELYLRVKQWFWGSFGGKETNSKPQLATREYSLHIHPSKTLPRD